MSEVIYTPSGLKIRLDPGRVARVLAPVQHQINLTDAFLSVQTQAVFTLLQRQAAAPAVPQHLA